MTWYDKIKGWSEMPPTQKLNFLIGAIIVVLCVVIMHYEYQLSETRERKNLEIREIKTLHATRQAALEAKVDICNQNQLEYLRQSEQDYRELLFQFKRVKEKIDGNEGN